MQSDANFHKNTKSKLEVTTHSWKADPNDPICFQPALKSERNCALAAMTYSMDVSGCSIDSTRSHNKSGAHGILKKSQTNHTVFVSLCLREETIFMVFKGFGDTTNSENSTWISFGIADAHPTFHRKEKAGYS